MGEDDGVPRYEGEVEEGVYGCRVVEVGAQGYDGEGEGAQGYNGEGEDDGAMDYDDVAYF